MVSISKRNTNSKNDGPLLLPILYFCLGAIFMSLFGRMFTMMNLSSAKTMYRNQLDPRAVLDAAEHRHKGALLDLDNASGGSNVGVVDPAEGGLPIDNSPNQEYQHFVNELKHKQQALTELQDKYDQAQTQLKEQQEKITKYESVVDELYKSRRRYGESEEQKESLNVTLAQVEDKMEQVRSILRGGGGGNGVGGTAR